MKSGLLLHLLNLVGDPAGTLKKLLRKGLAALRGLCGRGGGFLRELIKRVVSFFGSKIAPVAAGARDTLKSSLESLKRRAHAVMQGKAPPPEPDHTEPAPESADAVVPEAPESAAAVAEPTAREVHDSAPTPVSPATLGTAEIAPAVGAASEDGSTADPSSREGAQAPRGAPNEPGKLRRPREIGRSRQAEEGSLTNLAPALRRVFARALVRPGGGADTRRAA